MKYILFSSFILLSTIGNINCFSQDKLNAKLPKSLQKIEYDSLRPLSSELARIIFHRKSNIVGAAGGCYLFDSGNNIGKNVFIRQIESTTSRRNPDGKIIQSIYLLLDDKWSVLMQGTIAYEDIYAMEYFSEDSLAVYKETGDKFVRTNINVHSDFQLLSENSGFAGGVNNIISETKVEVNPFHFAESDGNKTRIGLNSPSIYINNPYMVYNKDPIRLNSGYAYINDVYRFNIQSYEANSQFLDMIKNNETIIWDRPSGIMKLEYIDAFENSAISPEIEVKQGHTYLIEFTYGFKPTYEITELN